MKKRRVFPIGIMFISMIMIGATGCGDTPDNGSDRNYTVTYGTYPATIDEKTFNLEYRLIRPDGSSPRPLVIMTHGRNGPHPQRNTAEVDGYKNVCTALAQQGYVVMMLVRRGYGKSDGPDSELKDTPYECGLEAAKDLLSAVEYMKTQSYVDPQKIVVMGHSQGGWAAIAFSTLKAEGVLGTVNLSGGTNYTDINSDNPDTVYSKWVSDCGEYGKINMVPTLWIYSPNDQSIPDVASQPMFKSFQDAGGQGTFVMKPNYEPNGHWFFDEPGFYMDDLLAFFNAIGLTDTI